MNLRCDEKKRMTQELNEKTTQYVSNIDIAGVAALLGGQAKRVAVTTHAKPDGDAYGSVVALAHALRAIGHDVTAILMPPVPRPFDVLLGRDEVVVADNDYAISGDDVDMVIIVDTGAWGQVSPLRASLEPLVDRTLIIDHHLSGDVPAAHRYVDGQAAACAEIIAQVIDELGVAFDATISQALFVGIASDTGWFRFSNTRPRTHELAARLLANGVDHAALYLLLEQGERPEKLALLIRALDSLEMRADGRAAIMTLRSDDFKSTHALLEETERFVDVPQIVGSVEVVVLVTEPPAAAKYESTGDGQRRETPAIRLSFRSKPGDDAINVADLAATFGGGGHARASGAKVEASLNEVLGKVRDAVDQAFS